MQSHWRIFTDTKTPEKALKLITKLKTRLDREPADVRVEPYHKGGHVVSLDLSHDAERWNDVVVDILTCAQTIGFGWSLSAFVQEEIELTTTHTSVAGIKMINCFCARPGTPNAT